MTLRSDTWQVLARNSSEHSKFSEVGMGHTDQNDGLESEGLGVHVNCTVSVETVACV
jgi:hypothetical protein